MREHTGAAFLLRMKPNHRFLLPVTEDGELTEWAKKALAAQVGAAVGAKSGEEVGKVALGKVPFAGGLLAGAAKKKGKLTARKAN